MINNKLINNTQIKFNLDLFSENYQPQMINKFKLDKALINEKRVNHYLIKNPNDSKLYTQDLHKNIIGFISNCLSYTNVIPDIDQRYIYLTFDNMKVEVNTTQRQDGWHIDGLQGDEVSNKVNNCFQFICCDSLPTIFNKNKVDLSKYSLSKHNIFNAIQDNINEQYNYEIEKDSIYLINPYMPHKSMTSDKSQDRLFVRLYFSHLPITSIKATINPHIKYTYKYHTTSGDIPKYLK